MYLDTFGSAVTPTAIFGRWHAVTVRGLSASPDTPERNAGCPNTTGRRGKSSGTYIKHMRNS